MPELPEAEVARRVIHNHCIGKKIIKVVTEEQGGGPRTGLVDDKVLASPAEDIQKHLLGKSIEAACRKGKQLWWKMSGDQHLHLHLGMSGAFRVKGVKTATYRRNPTGASADEWPPRFSKLEVCFEDGTKFAYINSRRFGRVRLTPDPEGTPPISKLGFDPQLELPGPSEFYELLQRKSGPIKAVLLDQSFAAGVGNYIADEVLYQAQVHPSRPVWAIDSPTAERIRERLGHVVGFACDVGAEYTKFPKDWLFHYRWDKGKGGAGTDAAGNKLVYDTVGGRTTAIVEAVQGKKDWGKPPKKSDKKGAKGSSTSKGKGKGKSKAKGGAKKEAAVEATGGGAATGGAAAAEAEAK